MPDFFATCKVQWKGPKVKAEVRRATGKGLDAAAIFLTARLKEVLSSPAPRKRMKSKTGLTTYRATTPATPGAPPRKLSGHLRRGHTWEKVSDLIRRVGTNVKYARRHEKGNHRYLLRTVKAVKSSLKRVIGARARQSYKGV